MIKKKNFPLKKTLNRRKKKKNAKPEIKERQPEQN